MILISVGKREFRACCILDVSLMASAAQCLEGRHDFKSFCASGSSVKHTQRTIKSINVSFNKDNLSYLSCDDKGLMIIEIEADGFLFHMVRNIVGTLIDIGRGYLAKNDMKRILDGKDRKLAGPTVPAKGLYLCQVKY